MRYIAPMVSSHTARGEKRAMIKIKTKVFKFDRSIQKWATRLAAIATIVGFLTAGGGWMIHQVDNAVATRIESQTNSIQAEVQKLSEKLDDHEKQSELSAARLELMMLMGSDPYNTVEIEKVAHHYFVDLGGNYYLTSEYSQYCKKYAADCEIMFK